ncbi:hypothetical protein [Calothrix sp. CCY 0018]|uniref:hypothetical protein n=1 Tax=Calothrix sp. CCY 0018 TaxID=3103864 RepID=UPI0039C71082
MGKKYHDVRVLMHRAAVFLTVFLISDVGRVYASRNLQIIAQQGETQTDATRAEVIKLMEEGRPNPPTPFPTREWGERER